MKKALAITVLVILWTVASVLTLWLLLMTGMSSSHLYLGRTNAYSGMSEIRAYAIWEGYLFKDSPARLSVTFPLSESDRGRFRYKPGTGMMHDWPEAGGPDGDEIGVLNEENVIMRVAEAFPERDGVYHQRLGEDVVRLIDAALRPGSASLGAADNEDLLADENGDMPPAEGWNLVRPSYGGAAPWTLRRSADWTMLLILAPVMIAGGMTALVVRRLRRSVEPDPAV